MWVLKEGFGEGYGLIIKVWGIEDGGKRICGEYWGGGGSEKWVGKVGVCVIMGVC